MDVSWKNNEKTVPSPFILMPLPQGRYGFDLVTCLEMKAGQKSCGMEGDKPGENV